MRALPLTFLRDFGIERKWWSTISLFKTDIHLWIANSVHSLYSIEIWSRAGECFEDWGKLRSGKLFWTNTFFPIFFPARFLKWCGRELVRYSWRWYLYMWFFHGIGLNWSIALFRSERKRLFFVMELFVCNVVFVKELKVSTDNVQRDFYTKIEH